MTTQTKQLDGRDLLDAAYAAISRELGPSGLIRFLQQTSSGQGDYTRERQCRPQPSIEEIVRDIEEARRDAKEPDPAQTPEITLEEALRRVREARSRDKKMAG